MREEKEETSLEPMPDSGPTKTNKTNDDKTNAAGPTTGGLLQGRVPRNCASVRDAARNSLRSESARHVRGVAELRPRLRHRSLDSEYWEDQSKLAELATYLRIESLF